MGRMTVSEYAKKNNISKQTVYTKMKRKEEKLKGHIFYIKAEHVYVIGSYYYIFEYEQLYKSDNYDVFIYENGAFIKPAETVAMSYYDEYSPNVGNFDIRAAIDKMIDAIPQ